VKAWIVAAAAASISVAVAAPASADDSEYLNALQGDTYLVDTYSNQELLSEGYKVCNAVSHGAREIDAVEMVERDLSVSSHAAIAIYSAATVMLGC
jgi:hypothetical protein